MKFYKFLLGCLLIICFTSCKITNSGTKSLTIGRIAKPNRSQHIISQAIALHTNGNLGGAIEILQNFVETNTKETNLGQAYVLLIRYLLQANKETKARNHASYFLDNFPRSNQAQEIIDLFDNNNLQSRNNYSNFKQKLINLEKRLQTSNTPEKKQITQQKIHNLITQVIPLKLAENICQDKTQKKYWGLCGQRIAQYYLHIGENKQAYEILNRAWPHANKYSKPGLEAIRIQIDSTSNRIFPVVGLLLPLSGPFKNFGARALSAISIALGSKLENMAKSISTNHIAGVTWIVADSQGDPKIARRQTETLIKKYKSRLILGGIIADCAHSAAQIAQASDIPTIIFTRYPNIPKIGARIFSFAPSYSQEMAALAHYAINKKNYSRFAVLYPQHNYGIQLAEIFTNEITKRGGQIRALESYESYQTTFTGPISKLIGMYYLDARPEFKLCQEQFRQEKNIKLREKKLKECEKNIKPLVDFDALFIPELAKLPFVVPALESADILISSDPKEKERFSRTTKIAEPQYVQLLGTSAWHQPQIIKKISRPAQGALFIDIRAYESLEPSNIFHQKFYQYAQSPPRVLELFLHDGALLAQLLLQKQSKIKLQEQIAQFHGSPGFLGPISFDSYGNIKVQLSGFIIKPKEIQKMDNIQDAT